jgi:protein O-GlcNAc transferase
MCLVASKSHVLTVKPSTISIMMSLIAACSVLSVLLLAYLVRGSRELGTKLSKLQSSNLKNFKEIEQILAVQERSAKRSQQLLYLPYIQGLNPDWKFEVSVTSHPARFDALATSLIALKNQVLQPQTINVYIANNDIAALPHSVKELEKSKLITIVACDDLGSGKKLIPALNKQDKLPIIAIDDDLYFENDLFLHLMINHYLYPDAIIAARVHRLAVDAAGNVLPFSSWHKHYDLSEGPSADLMPTSGAGTLFPPKTLHEDAADASLYSKLSHNTDDLWWYFQARRKGTLVRRLSGMDHLNFIDSTQEVGLWKNGNQDRNEVNLKALLSAYGNPINN